MHQYVDRSVEQGPDGELTPFTPESHAAACHLHAVFIHPYDVEPVYVCRNPAEAGHQSIYHRPSTAPTSPSDANAEDGGAASVDVAAAEADRIRQEEERRRQTEEEQRQRAEAEAAEAERREALAIATGLRRGFLATLVRRGGKAHLQAVLRLMLTENFEVWAEQVDLEDAQLLATLVDAEVPAQTDEMSGDELWEAIEGNLRAALSARRTPEALAGALLAIVAHDREWTLAAGHGWSNPSCRRYMDFLIGQGYEPTDLERELLHENAVID